MSSDLTNLIESPELPADRRPTPGRHARARLRTPRSRGARRETELLTAQCSHLARARGRLQAYLVLARGRKFFVCTGVWGLIKQPQHAARVRRDS